MRIGVFDSGLGGIAILKDLIKYKPNNEYIYFGDTINLPYGEKTKEQLKEYADKIIKFLKEKEVDLIIIACGTISSNIYEEIKDKYNIPIYDIINPICNFLEHKCDNVLLLATSMTIKSKVFKDKLELKNIKVYDKECPMFVPIIEGKEEDINKYIDEYLNEYRNKNIDLIIPGCTHYPLISKELENYLDVPVLDIGYIIASSLDIKDSKKGIEIYFSKIDESLKENVKKIIGDIDIKLKKL